MIIHYLNEFTIKISEYTKYSPSSSDNINNYQAEIWLNEHEQNWTNPMYASKYCIEIHNSNGFLMKVIVIGPNGRITSIGERSTLIDDDNLILIIGDFICSLSIPNLTINWKLGTPCITCFKLFKFDNAYLIHGEIEITKVSRKGLIEWSFSGRDVFVSPEGGNEFEIRDDLIYIHDWEKNLYILNKDGKLLN